jgi:hypothetical protein
MEHRCDLVFPPHQSLHSSVEQCQTRIRAVLCCGLPGVQGSCTPVRGPRDL